jgi:hypothetical protein
MQRHFSNWLDGYLEYTANTESPKSYHVWCGLSVLAGALQRKIYLKWGLGRVIYPNLYVILVGASGRTRKGIAIGIAKDMLKKLGTVPICPESSSGKQAMISAMKRSVSTFQDPSDDNLIKTHVSISAFSEELSVFLGERDIKYLAALTDWYDSKDSWEYETISRGQEYLTGVCFNFLGGTAPDWISSMLPQEAIGGGFTSRIIFIVEEKKRKTIVEFNKSEEEKELEKKLLADLEQIHQICGEFTFSQEAKELYSSWYLEQDENLSKGNPVIQDTRFAGYCERRATHVQKLALIISAARNSSKVVQKEDFLIALNLLEEAEIAMPSTFGGLGLAKNSHVIDILINYIKTQRRTTRKLLLQRFYRDIDSQGLQQAEILFQQMGVIEMKLLENGDKLYTWKGD